MASSLITSSKSSAIIAPVSAVNGPAVLSRQYIRTLGHTNNYQNKNKEKKTMMMMMTLLNGFPGLGSGPKSKLRLMPITRTLKHTLDPPFSS